ncbi:MAG TPA: hypothetical protein VFI20_09440 [Terracidiphilus sp.]|nr:hypothetical protein [Terracidiphilus sp.]
MKNDVKLTTLELLGYCRDHDWAGFEPYDVLNSPLFSEGKILDKFIPRLAFTQLLKRSPVNVRGLLRVPPTQNPKAIGLFLSGLVSLARLGMQECEADITYLIERARALRSDDPQYWCWGYNFPWQGRVVYVPRWDPNLVCTTFVAAGLLDVYEWNHNEALLSMAKSAAEYILNELYWEKGDVCGFAYPLPTTRGQVHNANLLAAALFCRVYSLTGEEKFLAPALKSARYSVRQQHADGRWNYGQGYKQEWVDNFHTGFNLGALRSITRCLGTSEFEPAVRLGFKFYRDHFFREDGAVRYFHDRTYPIDTHCVAQSIITLLDLSDLDSSNVKLAETVYAWARRHMWSEKKHYFYYRILRGCKIRTSYMRWTQAWMFLALSTLTCVSEGAPAQRPSALEGASR